MKSIQGQWVFIAFSLFLFLQCLSTQQYAWWMVSLLWLLRILYLEIKVLKILVIVCSLGGTIHYHQSSKANAIEDQLYYEIIIDPYHQKNEKGFLQGEAILFNKRKRHKVSIIFWENEAIPPIDRYQRWIVEGTLDSPSVARNFGVFDYANYLKSKGIFHQLTIKKIAKTENILGLKSFFLNSRYKFIQFFKNYGSLPFFGIYNKLMWNIDSQEYQAIRQTFIQLGIIHFFALSGFHVSIIMNKLNYLFRRVGILNEINQVLVYFIIGVYAFLTGFAIGVLRSVLVRLFRNLLKLTIMDSLSLVGILMMLLQPVIVTSVGFQLSFLISFILQFIKKDERMKNHEFLAYQTLICLLFTLPITISQNYAWYPLQILWIVLISIVFEKLMLPFFLVMTTLTFMPTLTIELLRKINLSFDWMSSIFSQQLYFPIGSLSAFWLILLYLIAIASVINFKSYYKYVISIYVLMCFFAGTSMVDQITILDVGQGDAVIYQKAFSRRALLVDVGGKPLFNDFNIGPSVDAKFAQRTVIPAIQALGISQLDIVITHPDIDHIGNLEGILNAFQLQQLIISRTTSESNIFNELSKSANKNRIIVLDSGKIYKLEKYSVTLITMDDEFIRKSQDKSNDSSIITYYQDKQRSFINMGDLSSEGETNLMHRFPKMKSQIIKLGHHGSKTSTSVSWIEHLNSEIALISAGVNNRYGHPHQEVIQHLREKEIDIFQTNQVGAIQIKLYPFNLTKILYKIN